MKGSRLQSCAVGARVHPAVAAVFVVAGLVGAPEDAAAWRTAADLPAYPDGIRVAWAAGPVRYSTVQRPPSGWSELEFVQAVGRATDAWQTTGCAPEFGDAASPVEAAVSGDGVVTVQVLRARVANGERYE